MNRRLATVASAVVIGVVLTGCGSSGGRAGSAPATSTLSTTSGATSGPTSGTTADAASYARTPAARIQRDVESALKAATSLHMAGSIVESGTKIDFDVSVDTAGHCTGTMGLKGSTIDLLGVGGDYYFKAPRSFWQSQDAAHVAAIWALVGGKWVKMGGGSQGSEMSSLCNLTVFTDGMFGRKDNGTLTSVVGPSQYDGQPTVQLSGKTGDGSATSIQVLAASPHYPVHLDAGRQGSVTFSRFDEPVSVAAPPSSQVVDLSKLG